MTDTAPGGHRRLRPATRPGIRHLGDFTTNPRVLFVAAVALLVGTGG